MFLVLTVYPNRSQNSLVSTVIDYALRIYNGTF